MHESGLEVQDDHSHDVGEQFARQMLLMSMVSVQKL